MTVTAYLLVQAEVGTVADVADAISELENVMAADVTMGPYDVIAQVKASDVDSLGRMILTDVQKISGVERTLLCPVTKIEVL